jgi:hypothetical protein
MLGSFDLFTDYIPARPYLNNLHVNQVPSGQRDVNQALATAS